MSGSPVGIWIMCVVVVLALIAWPLSVRLAGRRPHSAHPQRGQLRGVVQGGQHVGGGRSVAPTRDAPVPAGGGEPPAIEEEVAAHDGHHSRGSGNPLDL
jgi:hypothetical protein